MAQSLPMGPSASQTGASLASASSRCNSSTLSFPSRGGTPSASQDREGCCWNAAFCSKKNSKPPDAVQYRREEESGQQTGEEKVTPGDLICYLLVAAFCICIALEFYKGVVFLTVRRLVWEAREPGSYWTFLLLHALCVV